MNVHSTMLQSKGNGNSRSAAGGAPCKAGWTPQVVLVELKGRILAALSRLADRDTYQVGLEDLESIAHSLTADGIGIFLSCLYETDVMQKLVLRKECVRLIGTLASLHGEMLSPHLPRIVTNLVRRLKDPDSAVRDACVDVIGMLAANVPYPPGGAAGGGSDDIVSVAASSAAVGVYLKPLLDAMSEQSKGAQVGAALCLSRVFDELKRTPTGIVQRLVPRILKLMNSHVFQAKAALLAVVGSLARSIGEAGPGGMPLLAMVAPLFPECLESSDWTIRKAAADTLVRMAMVLGPALSSFKATLLPALEACRFDKVKPVRDCVSDALTLWKNVPDFQVDQTCPVSLSGGPAAGDRTSSFTSPARRSDDEAARRRKPLFGLHEEGPVAGLTPITTEGLSGRKRSPLLGDRKRNPDFFRKLEKSSDGVQIEISAPSLPWGSNKQVAKDDLRASGNDRSAIERSTSYGEPKVASGSYDKECTGDAVGAESQPDASVAYAAGPGIWTTIRKHLEEIERQQAHLIAMFQSFAGSSQDRMANLEATINGLERAIGHVSRHAAACGFGAPGAGTGGAFETQVRRSQYTSDCHQVSSPCMAGGSSDCSDMRYSFESDVSRVNRNILQVHTERPGDSSVESQRDDDSPLWQVTEDRKTMEGGSRNPFQFQSVPGRSVWHSVETRATLSAIRGTAQHEEGMDIGMRNLSDVNSSPSFHG